MKTIQLNNTVTNNNNEIGTLLWVVWNLEDAKTYKLPKKASKKVSESAELLRDMIDRIESK
jgi:hypothetical protein